jgi:hypothetical protein
MGRELSAQFGAGMFAPGKQGNGLLAKFTQRTTVKQRRQDWASIH